jgi:hypothetical protein
MFGACTDCIPVPAIRAQVLAYSAFRKLDETTTVHTYSVNASFMQVLVTQETPTPTLQGVERVEEMEDH